MSQNIITVTQEDTSGNPLVSSYTENGKTYSPAVLRIVNNVDSNQNPIKSGMISTLTGDISSQNTTTRDLSNVIISNTISRTIGSRYGDYVNVIDFGMNPSNSDNTTNFQNAINYAISKGKSVYIPSGVYKITPPISITGAVKIVGDGCFPIYGNFQNNRNAINIPTASPYFNGSVLSAVSNGNNIFECTGQCYSFSGEDFGCIFQTLFSNTGHMVNFYNGNIGLLSSSWKNVGIYGHDGNHYMFNVENMLYNIFENCMAYGGGMINSHTSQMQCGNSTMIRCLNMIIVSGTANGYNFSSGSGWSQQLNSLISIQCITNSQPFDDGLTPSKPTGSQLLLNCDENCHQFSLISPDFETLVGSYSILPKDMAYIDIISGGLGSGYRFAGDSDYSLDYMQGASKVQNGYCDATSTTGTFTFPQPFYNTAESTVVLTGIGITASLSSKPTGSQFSYTLSAPGTFSWIAIGK